MHSAGREEVARRTGGSTAHDQESGQEGKTERIVGRGKSTGSLKREMS